MTLLTAAVGGWVIARDSGSGHAPAPPLVTVEAVEQLHLGGTVQDTTTLAGGVWVLTCRRHCSQASSAAPVGELIELTATGRPILRRPVTDATILTSGAGAIWVAHFHTGAVSRVDPRTGRTTATTHLRFAKPITTSGRPGFEPSGISFGAGRLWVSSPFGYVAEINPLTTRLERIVFTSSEVTSATTAGGLTWIADELAGVGTFAPGSNRVAVHPISWAGEPVDVQTIAYGAGLVWALGAETDSLTSMTDPTTVGVLTTLDPRTGRIIDQWQLSPAAAAMVVGHGGAYVGDGSHGHLVRLTPQHGSQLLPGPKAVMPSALTPGAVWAINRDGQLLRISVADG